MNAIREPAATAVVWMRTSVVVGTVACVIYPALVFLHPPRMGLVVLAATLGPAAGVTSIGLGKLLQLPRASVSAQLATIFNFTAGVLVSTMLLVQLAIKARLHGTQAPPESVAIWLGLDVAFDVYIGLGTGLYALAMLRHPRFGRIFGGIGLVLAASLLILNLVTFPTPPAAAGLFDIGPVVGVWYLAVIVQTWRSLRWARSIGLGETDGA